jgi:hypothetical protein
MLAALAQATGVPQSFLGGPTTGEFLEARERRRLELTGRARRQWEFWIGGMLGSFMAAPFPVHDPAGAA